MEWLVEFERRMPSDAVRSLDFKKLAGSLEPTVDHALMAAAAPEDIARLQVVFHVKTNGSGIPEWRFKLVGPGYVRSYVRRLIDDTAPILPTSH